ncbi:hypothetical protein EX30DRAFT_249466 [Ascodesmis nigricans]|uniref:Uncharacterized protein n=1 Tax=Ascodesmis nigricans TaxID=341454 RepID=A0A4S2MXY1_9PEZI|nr:hypothetical protein EX30DRAFT_249466 [Ascodesmis nigricans]
MAGRARKAYRKQEEAGAAVGTGGTTATGGVKGPVTRTLRDAAELASIHTPSTFWRVWGHSGSAEKSGPGLIRTAVFLRRALLRHKTADSYATATADAVRPAEARLRKSRQLSCLVLTTRPSSSIKIPTDLCLYLWPVVIPLRLAPPAIRMAASRGNLFYFPHHYFLRCLLSSSVSDAGHTHSQYCDAHARQVAS